MCTSACPQQILHARQQAKGTAAKEAKVMVRVLDVKTLSWAVLTPSGDAPTARGSHSVRRQQSVGVAIAYYLSSDLSNVSNNGGLPMHAPCQGLNPC
jgi:hypothetical protein